MSSCVARDFSEVDNVRVAHVETDVPFNQLSGQRFDCAMTSYEPMQDRGAFFLLITCALDRVEQMRRTRLRSFVLSRMLCGIST